MINTGFVLDDTFLTELTQGGTDAINAFAALSARQTRLSVPAAALAVALSRGSEEQAEAVTEMVANLEHVRLHPLGDHAHLVDLTDLAQVVGHIGPDDLSAAHTVHVAQVLDWDIVTADRARWNHADAAVPWPIRLVLLSSDQ